MLDSGPRKGEMKETSVASATMCANSVSLGCHSLAGPKGLWEMTGFILKHHLLSLTANDFSFPLC